MSDEKSLRSLHAGRDDIKRLTFFLIKNIPIGIFKAKGERVKGRGFVIASHTNSMKKQSQDQEDHVDCVS